MKYRRKPEVVEATQFNPAAGSWLAVEGSRGAECWSQDSRVRRRFNERGAVRYYIVGGARISNDGYLIESKHGLRSEPAWLFEGNYAKASR